jgi:hypothetical protein
MRKQDRIKAENTVSGTEDQLCAYFNENFNIVNDICEIILINTSLNDNTVITVSQWVDDVNRTFFDSDSN